MARSARLIQRFVGHAPHDFILVRHRLRQRCEGARREGAGALVESVDVLRHQRLTPEQRRARHGLRARRPSRVRRALKRMDADRNGAISRQEWKRRPELFDRLDTNKDGQITRDEFRAARRAARRIR